MCVGGYKEEVLTDGAGLLRWEPVAEKLLTLSRGISRACWIKRCISLICCRTRGGTGLQQAMMPCGSLETRTHATRHLGKQPAKPSR